MRSRSKWEPRDSPLLIPRSSCNLLLAESSYCASIVVFLFFVSSTARKYIYIYIYIMLHVRLSVALVVSDTRWIVYLRIESALESRETKTGGNSSCTIKTDCSIVVHDGTIVISLSTYLLPLPTFRRSIAFILLSARVRSNRLKTRPGCIYRRAVGPGQGLEKTEVIWKWKSRNIINIFTVAYPRSFHDNGTRDYGLFTSYRRFWLKENVIVTFLRTAHSRDSTNSF